MHKLGFVAAFAAAITPLVAAVASQTYNWRNVKIGGGGGFVPGIVFNPTEKGLAYARTDIGGAYRMNADHTWTPLLDFADHARWNYWGVDALATDPVEPRRLYLATGMYTNSWDPNNGQILISTDYGRTFSVSKLPFKVGGNMPGRGMGERLAIDPNRNSILFFGARSGNGLWKSTNYGTTWTKVSSFPDAGTYIPDPNDANGYNNDKVGISFVTFDSTSGSSGNATPRIFVGVASVGSSNVFVSNDGGSTWSAVAGQSTTYMPHKGVLSPAEKVLYVSYSDGAGPYDGTKGAVYKYDITARTWTNITPASGDDLYFGFGGLAVDLQKPGTIMVAALNSWWPDGQIFRSTDSGATWSPLWSWEAYPNINKWYKYDNSLAPWLGPSTTITELGELQIGWMMEALVIDPFDSNHWLYGTGATIYGGNDLLRWDSVHNVTIKSLADGIEETAVLGLISPPSGPSLISSLGDIQGFVHNSLTTAPRQSYTNPTWSTSSDLDYAGNKPSNLVRIGTGDSSSGKQCALSSDSGATWSQNYGAADSDTGGKVAISADGDTVLWRTSNRGVIVSQYTNPFQPVSSLPSGAQIASDKRNNSVFYAASGSRFYTSRDGGRTFTSPSALGSSTAPFKVIVHPSVTGDVWVSTDKGIFHSTNFGSSFTQVNGPTEAWSIALGAPRSSGGYPALYAAATIDSTTGYYRSDDAGANWVHINDDKLGFGTPSANVMTADLRTYGRVYVGTNGRGIFYGDASGTAPEPTVTPPTQTENPGPTTTNLPGTTEPGTTQPPTITSPPAPGQTAGPYGQCGGNNWTGPTVCASGYRCNGYSEWYHQCIPV